MTINENIDPDLVDDFERAFGRVVGEDWDVAPRRRRRARTRRLMRARRSSVRRSWCRCDDGRARARHVPGHLLLRVRRARARGRSTSRRWTDAPRRRTRRRAGAARPAVNASGSRRASRPGTGWPSSSTMRGLALLVDSADAQARLLHPRAVLRAQAVAAEVVLDRRLDAVQVRPRGCRASGRPGVPAPRASRRAA